MELRKDVVLASMCSRKKFWRTGCTTELVGLRQKDKTPLPLRQAVIVYTGGAVLEMVVWTSW